jgi:cobalt/nickel transport system permease protein
MSHIHIPDGVLPLWLWLPGWVVALVLVAIAGKLAEKSDARRKVPLIAVVSAMMLVAMSSEIVPLAYHINLTVVSGVLLGPLLSVIAAFIVQVVLAMLGHGGVTVLGLNTLITSTEMILGWALFRGFVALLSRRHVRWAAGISTVLTLAVTTTMLVGLVALAGGGAAASRDTGALDASSMTFASPFSSGVVRVGMFAGAEKTGEPSLSVARFAAVVYTLGSFGWVLEALVTAWILGYIARVRPALLWEGVLAEDKHHIIGDETGVR